MRILVIGPVGSGKSTQAQILAGELGIPLIMMGSLLREIASKDTKLGRLVGNKMHRGELVDDEIVVETIREKLKTPDRKGFVVDGYPRTKDQLSMFDPGFDRVFFLSLSDNEIKKRLAKRARQDDKPEVIKARLEAYYQSTLPIIEHYRQLGILTEISAGHPIEEVARMIREFLDGNA